MLVKSVLIDQEHVVHYFQNVSNLPHFKLDHKNEKFGVLTVGTNRNSNQSCNSSVPALFKTDLRVINHDGKTYKMTLLCCRRTCSANKFLAPQRQLTSRAKAGISYQKRQQTASMQKLPAGERLYRRLCSSECLTCTKNLLCFPCASSGQRAQERSPVVFPTDQYIESPK